MAKLPRIPPEWNDQPAPQETPLPGPDLHNRSGGLLDAWQQPGWSLENSGLGLLLHPQTIAQIDFGGGQRSHAVQPMAAQTPANAQTAQAPHWSAADNSVHLSDDMSGVAEAVGREFHARTGRNLVVTGGARTPARQAEVMYDKFRTGDGAI